MIHYHCQFINCNKCMTLIQGTMGGNYVGIKWNILCVVGNLLLSLNCYNNTTDFKNNFHLMLYK